MYHEHRSAANAGEQKRDAKRERKAEIQSWEPVTPKNVVCKCSTCKGIATQSSSLRNNIFHSTFSDGELVNTLFAFRLLFVHVTSRIYKHTVHVRNFIFLPPSDS